MYTVKGIIIGAVAGLVVTGLVATLWPNGKLRALRPLAAAVLGVGVAYLLMVLIK